MDIELLGKISHGANGTVYACKFNGTYGISKIEKYSGSTSTKENHMRQIIFNEFAEKHPDRFLTLLFSGVVNKCIFKQPTPENIKSWSVALRNAWLENQKQKKCSLLIYAPILNCTLNDFLNLTNPIILSSFNKKLSPEYIKLRTLKLNIFKFVKKSIDLMNNAGFYHRDLHPRNIMYRDKYFKSHEDLIKKIKTLKIDPKCFYIIDYGLTYSKSFEKTPLDVEINQLIQDDYNLLWNMCDNPIGDYLIANNIKLGKYDKGVKFLQSHALYPEIVKYLPTYVKNNMAFIKSIDFLHLICVLLDYDVYCEAIGVTELQKKLGLVGYKPAYAKYYLQVIKNMKMPKFTN